MSFVMNQRKRVQSLLTAVVTILVLASGCSNSDLSDSASALAEFAVDFAREVLAAWLL